MDNKPKAIPLFHIKYKFRYDVTYISTEFFTSAKFKI